MYDSTEIHISGDESAIECFRYSGFGYWRKCRSIESDLGDSLFRVFRHDGPIPEHDAGIRPARMAQNDCGNVFPRDSVHARLIERLRDSFVIAKGGNMHYQTKYQTTGHLTDGGGRKYTFDVPAGTRCEPVGRGGFFVLGWRAWGPPDLQKGGWLDFEAEHRGIRIQGIHVEPVPDYTGAGTA